VDITTAIIVDPYGTSSSTPATEAEELRRRYTRYVEPQSLKTYEGASVRDLRDGTDLVLFDYGGVLPGLEGLAQSEVRALLRWMEEHQHALVVVVSPFTFRHYVEWSLKDLGLSETPNLVLDDCPLDGRAYTPLPAWFRVMHGITNDGHPFVYDPVEFPALVAPPSVDDAFLEEPPPTEVPSPAEAAPPTTQMVPGYEPVPGTAWEVERGAFFGSHDLWRRLSRYAKDDFGHGIRYETYYFRAGGRGFGFTHDEPWQERKWPGLTLVVPLPVGFEKLREDLGARLRACVDAFLAEHGLDTQPTEKP